MIGGDFSFKDAPGGGLPIYNPASTRLVNGNWTRDPLPGNIVPRSQFDPVAVKFLSIGIWNDPNQTGSPARTGPSGNLLFNNTCRCLQRDRWDPRLGLRTHRATQGSRAGSGPPLGRSA